MIQRRPKTLNQGGFTMISVLLLLILMLTLGITSTVWSYLDLKSTQHYSYSLRALAVSESGIMHALNIINTIKVVDLEQDATTNGWDDSDGIFNGAVCINNDPLSCYWAMISDADKDSGFLYSVGTSAMNSLRIVRVGIRTKARQTGLGAIFLSNPGTPNFNIGGNAFVNGNDCDLGGNPTNSGIQVPGVTTQNDASTQNVVNNIGNSGSQVQGLNYDPSTNPPTPSVGTDGVDTQILNDLQNEILNLPGVITESSSMIHDSYGCPPDTPKIVHFTAPTIIMNAGAKICGIAIVDGQFDINGHAEINGLLIGPNILSNRLNGTLDIHGSLWTGSASPDLSGNMNACYSQQGMNMANDVANGLIYSGLPKMVEVISWTELPIGDLPSNANVPII